MSEMQIIPERIRNEDGTNPHPFRSSRTRAELGEGRREKGEGKGEQSRSKSLETFHPSSGYVPREQASMDGGRSQAERALAFVVHHIRPDWDERGILAAFTEARMPYAQLASVAIHAAFDPSARTPGVIPHRTPCAYVPMPVTPVPPPIRYERVPENQAEINARWTTLVRQALRQPRAELPPDYCPDCDEPHPWTHDEGTPDEQPY